MTIAPPAPSPCATCPYRQDVPSGVWHPDEYVKLPEYDLPTMYQPHGMFRCHLFRDESPRVCAGWAGCHEGDELLALRVGVATGAVTVETAKAVRDYRSPVPLFESGAEAAAHGMREVHHPGPDALRAISKLDRRIDSRKER